MKQLSIILNVVLLVCVGVLFYLHFSDRPAETQAASMADSVSNNELKIAYINADTVLVNYEFFKEKQKQLESRQQKLEAEYKNRAQGLQSEMANFQKSLPNLTMGQAKALEEDLMKKQQNLRMYQESLSQELMKEEAEINKELYDKVTSFIEDYSLENDIEVVVKYNQGSDILYAGAGMDITSQVIEGLNSRYNEDNKKTADTEN